MVDVTHHGDHRRTRQHLDSCSAVPSSFQEGFRVVELGGNRLVAHFLDHDHGRFLVQRLVDGDHLAQLHQGSLMTSAALTDILCARSATEMVSGTCTS